MRKIIRFFLPRNPLLWRIPRSQFQQANADGRTANTHELILMRQMYARNSIEARQLMEKHNATTAYEAIDAVNRHKPTIKHRVINGLKKFVRRMEGSTRSKPQMYDKTDSNRLPL